ncbi:hypothetical protein CsatA_028655 [Cannabis sativa]
MVFEGLSLRVFNCKLLLGLSSLSLPSALLLLNPEDSLLPSIGTPLYRLFLSLKVLIFLRPGPPEGWGSKRGSLLFEDKARRVKEDEYGLSLGLGSKEKLKEGLSLREEEEEWKSKRRWLIL